ncbi:MAG: signal peptidase I [bacterium]
MNTKRNAMTPMKSKTKRQTVAGRPSRKRKKNTARETTEAVLIALLAAMLLRAFVVQAFRIPTGSMKDTLLVGDFLLVNKFVYGVRTPDRIPLIDAEIPFFRLPSFKQPKNGDVVVFKYPKEPKLDYIKRCIATPGQTLEIRNGEVFIDGQPEGKRFDLGKRFDPEDGRYFRYTRMTTPYGKTYTTRHYVEDFKRNDNYGPTVVPDGHYFMMGDNRDNSSDSRVWGFVPADNIVGEALIIYFSWSKSGTFAHFFDSIRWSRIANLIN